MSRSDPPITKLSLLSSSSSSSPLSDLSTSSEYKTFNHYHHLCQPLALWASGVCYFNKIQYDQIQNITVYLIFIIRHLQTPQKLLVFYRTEEGLWPDFVDFKHDYTQEFCRSYSIFISKCLRTGKFRGICICNHHDDTGTTMPCKCPKSLWLSNALWWQRSGSTMA